MGWRKQGFALDWMLPRSGSSPMLSYLNTSCLEGWEGHGRLELQLAKQQSPLSARMGMLGRPVVSLCSHGAFVWSITVMENTGLCGNSPGVRGFYSSSLLGLPTVLTVLYSFLPRTSAPASRCLCVSPAVPAAVRAGLAQDRWSNVIQEERMGLLGAFRGLPEVVLAICLTLGPGGSQCRRETLS